MNTPQSRKKFMTTCLLSTAGLCSASLLASCHESQSSAPVDTDSPLLSIDLSQPINSALRTTGGYIITNNIIIVRYSDAQVIARSALCTHEGQELIWDNELNMIRCPRHGARYTPDGVVTQGPASDNLTRYRAVLQDTIVRVYKN